MHTASSAKRLACVIIGCALTILPGYGVLFTTGAPGTVSEDSKRVTYSKKELTAATYYLPKDILQVVATIEEQTPAPEIRVQWV